jgi:2-octaprenyl-6-methoxyphenol hydroxylase
MSSKSASHTSSGFDVAIVGGGLVGASLAAALAGSPVRVLLVESVPLGAGAQPSFDERTTALGNATRRIFEGLGVWGAIAAEAAAIRAIHVSDAGRFGFARLAAAEHGIEAFGYVAANRRIGAALWGQLRTAENLELRVPGRVQSVAISPEGVRLEVVTQSAAGAVSAVEPVTARLVVAADGAHSQIRAAAGIDTQVEDYDQVAIVANVATDAPHEGTAYERFTATGPLALLPLHDGNRAVIWACRPAHAADLLSLDETAFLARLQQRFGWRAGRFVRAARRLSYPLKLTRAAAPAATRTVLIGNAAQALHPVAGQGFNLGVRDAAMLAEVIVDAAGDVGSPELLERFSAWRARDRRGVVRFTDSLVKLFGDGRFGVAALRDLGLLLFDLAPPAKGALARVSSGFGGPAPRLARGLPVRRV